MKTKIYILFYILGLYTINNTLIAEQSGISIDTVVSFKAGDGQNSGQSAEYFPMNIFGIPSRYPNDKIPESSPTEVLSLGLGGEIIVSFKNYSIIDGEGVDFVIFENVFTNPINKKLFVEPAIVSVSQDGINFTEFPYDFKTLEGCAGLTPTFGENNPFDYPSGGGDGFDLADIGLSEIKFIKIKDITVKLLKDLDHFYYDPIISGFDLDAVVGINFKSNSIINSIKIENKCQKQDNSPIHNINLTDNKLFFQFKQNETNSDYQLILFDLMGNIIHQTKISSALEQNHIIEAKFPKIVLLKLIYTSHNITINNQIINLKIIRE